VEVAIQGNVWSCVRSPVVIVVFTSMLLVFGRGNLEM
jgi:hypothetical protein